MRFFVFWLHSFPRPLLAYTIITNFVSHRFILPAFIKELQFFAILCHLSHIWNRLYPLPDDVAAHNDDLATRLTSLCRRNGWEGYAALKATTHREVIANAQTSTAPTAMLLQVLSGSAMIHLALVYRGLVALVRPRSRQPLRPTITKWLPSAS